MNEYNLTMISWFAVVVLFGILFEVWMYIRRKR